MTIKDVISKVKEETQNNESNATLISYINQVEWEIYREVIETHTIPDDETIEFNGYDADTDLGTELIAVAPYADLYTYYVQSRIFLKRNEIDDYNNYIALFSAAMDDYKRWFTRNYRPKGLKNYRYFGG